MDRTEDIIFILGLLFIVFISVRMLNAFIAFVRVLFGASPAFKKLNPKYKIYLQKHFSFYNKLSTSDKEHFEKRVQLFIDLKTFIPRGGLTEITPELKAIIAGAAIQITFGYPHIYFKHFRKIIVFPDKYFSKITGQYHKGEVNSRGGIGIISTLGLLRINLCYSIHEKASIIYP
ncbi:MAG: zinc-dependent peptidase, partial [Salinivirgaceae bacterium]|nr:zinc-dependent peptidase [Salinivirgaceae bacterium]